MIDDEWIEAMEKQQHEKVDTRAEKMKADGASAHKAYEDFLEGWEKRGADAPETCWCPRCEKPDVVKLVKFGGQSPRYHYGCSKCGMWSNTCFTPDVAYKEWLAKVDGYAKEKQHDAISRPKHYADGAIECIDVIEQQEMPFHIANVQKYIWRWDKKGGVEDLAKARWYLDRFIRNLEKYE